MAIDDINWEQSQPRIVQYAGKRYALRLEKVFWDGLEALAARRHIRTGALIAELAGRYSGVNFSSYIRAYIMADARREQIRHDIALTPMDVIDILRACPAPGLLMQRNRTVVELNTSLFRWMAIDRIQGEEITPPPLRQQIFDTVFVPRVTRPLTDTMNLLYQGQLKRTQIQVVYTPPTPLGVPPLPGRAAIANLHGLHTPTGAFFCLVWFTFNPALQARPLTERPPVT